MMTEKQALKEARKRWGKKACTSFRAKAITKDQRDALRAKPKEQRTREDTSNIAGSWRYTVGIIRTIGGLMSFLEVQGRGDTWEEALAEADKKAQSDKERWAEARQAAGV